MILLRFKLSLFGFTNLAKQRAPLPHWDTSDRLHYKFDNENFGLDAREALRMILIETYAKITISKLLDLLF